MEHINPFNRFEILSSDFNFVQDAKEDEIKKRIIDGMLQPGSVIPAAYSGAPITPLQIQNGLPMVFPVTSAAAEFIDVGPLSAIIDAIHVAYNADGERIEVSAGDNVTFNCVAPSFTTDGTEGVPGMLLKNTPFSTGRRNIKINKAPTGTSEFRYVFISYLPVVRTKSLVVDGTPPNHLGLNGNIGLTPDMHRAPLTGIDEKEGRAYTHHQINGYRIYVALPSEVNLAGAYPVISSLVATNLTNPKTPANDPFSTNLPFTDYAKAIYIGRFTVDDTGAVTAIRPTVATADTAKPIMRMRSHVAAKIDTANPSTTYANGQVKTYEEHANAFGTAASITPNNPHKQTII